MMLYRIDKLYDSCNAASLASLNNLSSSTSLTSLKLVGEQFLCNSIISHLIIIMPAYVYKLTINNPKSTLDKHWYIGVRNIESENLILTDRYFGSGILIRNYIKTHGYTLISKDIIAFFEDSQNAFILERELVNSETLLEPLCLNKQIGGSGHGSKLSYISSKNNSDSMVGRMHYNDGNRGYLISPDDELISKLNLSPGKIRHHYPNKPKPPYKPRKSFARTEDHKNKMRISLSKRLDYIVKTPWGCYDTYLDAYRNYSPETSPAKINSKEALKSICNRPNRPVGSGGSKKLNPVTYAELGFGKIARQPDLA